MDFLQIEGKEIPLLESPKSYNETQRRIFYIFYVLFKYKYLIAKISLIVILPLLIVVLSFPKEYTASTKVLIKPTRAFATLSAGSDSRPDVFYPSPEIINNEIGIIKSKDLRQRLAKEVPYPGNGATNRGLLATPVKQSNIIQISLTSSNPQWAMGAVNRAAELYLEHHLKVHKTQGIEEFYDEQDKRLQTELTKAEDALKEFQVKEKIVDTSLELPSDLQSLAAFEKNLKDTDSTVRETEQKISVLETQLKQQQATISSNKNVTANPVYMQIMDRITKLELEKDNLLQRYTPKDRLVMDKEKEIEELKKRLGTVEATKVGSENISLNDVHRRILNELLQARVQLRALTEKKETLTKQVAEYSTMTAEKKQKSFEYDRLLQNVTAKKGALALYRQKAEEARISNAMDERKFSNAVILERASPPLPRAGWHPALLILATFIFSMGVAVGAAFIIDLLNATLKNEADIEEQTGLPVLATIEQYGIESYKG